MIPPAVVSVSPDDVPSSQKMFIMTMTGLFLHERKKISTYMSRMTDWVTEVAPASRHKARHFRDILPSQSPEMFWQCCCPRVLSLVQRCIKTTSVVYWIKIISYVLLLAPTSVTMVVVSLLLKFLSYVSRGVSTVLQGRCGRVSDYDLSHPCWSLSPWSWSQSWSCKMVLLTSLHFGDILPSHFQLITDAARQ